MFGPKMCSQTSFLLLAIVLTFALCFVIQTSMAQGLKEDVKQAAYTTAYIIPRKLHLNRLNLHSVKNDINAVKNHSVKKDVKKVKEHYKQKVINKINKQ